MSSSPDSTRQVSSLASPARHRALEHLSVPDVFPFRSEKGVKGGRYYLIQTLPEFEQFLEAAMQQQTLAVDTETSGLNWVTADGCGIVIGWGVESNFYLPIDHKVPDKQLDIHRIRPGLCELLGRDDTTKIFWNAKYDLHILRKLGLEVCGAIHDGVILSYLVDENSSHALKDLATLFIDKNAGHWERLVDKWRTDEAKRRRTEFGQLIKDKIVQLKQDPFEMRQAEESAAAVRTSGGRGSVAVELRKRAKDLLKDHPYQRNKKADISYDYIPLDIILPYACADVHYTWLLWRKFASEVMKDQDLLALYKTENALANVLFEVESHGIKIDVDYLNKTGPELDDAIKEMEEKVWQAVGYKFNVASDQELVGAFNKAGVRLTKLTKGSKNKIKQGGPATEARYSVDADVLEGLAAQHEFAKSVLDYRGACKLKSTYVEGILGLVDARHYLHSTFNQNVSTGRMSSSSPNVQNIPNRDRRIRKAFIVPDDEHFFVFIDYSQIELRLTAHYSQDPAMLACYPFHGEGTDVHSLTCAEVVMDLPYDTVIQMKEDYSRHDKNDPLCDCSACTVGFKRTISKRVNFGIIYGAGGPTIQRQVSTPKKPVSVDECNTYIDKYFAKYQGVHKWIYATHSQLWSHGFVQNAFGRYRRFPGMKNLQKWQQERAARQAVNFLIQGTAADLFKEAITRVYKVLQGSRTRIVNFVHDEMQFYWHRSELGLLKEVKHQMEDFDFSVPIVADIAYSTTDWASKKELKL